MGQEELGEAGFPSWGTVVVILVTESREDGTAVCSALDLRSAEYHSHLGEVSLGDHASR